MSLFLDKPVPAAARVRKQNFRLIFAGIVVVAALAFLVVRGLDDATMYFRTADEAIAQRSELDGKRFRIEGTVVGGSIKPDGAFVNFAIASKGSVVNVRNSGQPLGIFQENIPVVLEGRFAGASDVFESDRIMVRHGSDYSAKYPDRVSGAENK